jgi:predicted phosphodiesterase
MKTFLFGDTHGEFSKLEKDVFPEGQTLTKKDYVIILGDFGLLWETFGSRAEAYWANWLEEQPWTTLFISGNHEHYKRLARLPKENKFGGVVGKYSNSIYQLKRGNIYTINDKTFFAMGGAKSIDKHHRSVGINWWKQEVPNEDEIEFAKENILKTKEVDYVITHTSYKEAIDAIIKHNIVKYGPSIWGDKQIQDNTVDFLDWVNINLKYDKWFYGHMHNDFTFEKTTCLFKKYIEV